MGVQISMTDTNKQLFVSLGKAANSSFPVKLYEALVAKQCKVFVGFYTLTAVLPSQEKKVVTFDIGTNAIIKGTLSAGEAAAAYNALKTAFHGMVPVPEFNQYPNPYLDSPSAAGVTGFGVTSTPEKAPHFLSPEELAPAGSVKAAKPDKKKDKVPTTTDVVSLEDAQAVGQKVKGTDSSSVYFTVAVGKCKVAARLKANKTLSVRCEPLSAMSDELKQALNSRGFSLGGKHMSMHMNIDGVPVRRVLGSILMDFPEDFDDMVTNSNMVEVLNGKL